jgi:hypothetical protein
MNIQINYFINKLNDADWSSDISREENMKKLNILKFNIKDNFNTQYFVEQLALRTVNTILPIVLRKQGLEEHAKACEQAKTLQESDDAAYYASNAAANASYAANAYYAAANAYNAASYAAAKNAARYAYAAASYAAAARYAYNAARSAYAARSAEYASKVIGDDSMLLLSAKIAEDILIDMGVEGTQSMKHIELVGEVQLRVCGDNFSEDNFKTVCDQYLDFVKSHPFSNPYFIFNDNKYNQYTREGLAIQYERYTKQKRWL